jgi:hypothetical protein
MALLGSGYLTVFGSKTVVTIRGTNAGLKVVNSQSLNGVVVEDAQPIISVDPSRKVIILNWSNYFFAYNFQGTQLWWSYKTISTLNYDSMALPPNSNSVIAHRSKLYFQTVAKDTGVVTTIDVGPLPQVAFTAPLLGSGTQQNSLFFTEHRSIRGMCLKPFA